MKVTATTWLAPTPTDVAAFGAVKNCGASAPVSDGVKVRTAVPVLETTNDFCETKPTWVESIARLLTETSITGAVGVEELSPIPDRPTDVGLPEALCVMDNAADLAPADEGVKETVKV